MPTWEDYYEILQISPSAEPEVIEAAYRGLARKYHPDVNKEATAVEQMKKLNLAYEVLSDLQRRKEYHSQWLGQRAKPKETFSPKPKPVVNPNFIRFDGLEPGEIKKAFFVISNIGGTYSKIWFSNPDSWVRVVSWASVDPSQNDELPLRVEIEAEGKDWGKSYSEYIIVKLDEEETQVRIELQTKLEPIKEKIWVGVIPRTPPPPVTPLPSMRPSYIQPWQIMVANLFMLIILIIIWQWKGISYVLSQDTGPGLQYIQYGEQKKAQLSNKEQINVWYFNGEAGDVISIRIFPKEKNGMEAYLIDPNGNLIKKTRYTNSISFSFGDGIKFDDIRGYKLPSTGTYQVVVKILLGKKTTYEFILRLDNRT